MDQAAMYGATRDALRHQGLRRAKGNATGRAHQVPLRYFDLVLVRLWASRLGTKETRRVAEDDNNNKEHYCRFVWFGQMRSIDAIALRDHCFASFSVVLLCYS